MKNNSIKNRYSKHSLLVLILIGILIIIFKPWFFSQGLVGGDWGYIHSLQFTSFTLFPSAWETIFNLGYVNTSFIWSGILLHLYINLFGSFLNFNKLSLLGLFIPFLIIGIYSIRALLWEVRIKDSWAIFLGTTLYMLNTYILIVVGGGQIMVGLSYAIAPLVLTIFMRLIHAETNTKRSSKGLMGNINTYELTIYAGLVLGLQILFDPRIAYIILMGVGIYFSYYQIFARNSKLLIRNLLLSFIFVFLVPSFIAFMLHAVWIMPVIIGHTNPIQQLGVGFSSLDAVKFFSFAKLEDSISLLHPNWPENIFGKVGFLKPEFLMLPILAFLSLLFVKGLKSSKEKTYILFFALLGLLGAFLAKGANEPFGGIYLWMFDHVPGFIMFRDPTKWYTLVAISYSILIPFAIRKIYEFLKQKTANLEFKIAKYIPNLFIVLILGYILFLIRPAILGKLTGTLAYHSVDKSYFDLAKVLDSDNRFSRTLWIPSVQRFGFYSNNHPVINGKDFFNVGSLQDVVKILEAPNSKYLLQEASIKYIIIPYDSEKEIFIKDRHYSENEYKFAIKKLNNISWFKKYKIFGKIIVYTLESPKEHFWIYGSNNSLEYEMISPSEYVISIDDNQQGNTLIFSESYNAQWVAKTGDKIIVSRQFHELFNSFFIPGNSKKIKIIFKPQQWVNNSLWISLSTLLVVLILLILLKIYERNIIRNHSED
nr:hypothetical protein [Candidatus Levybacteria bacterium]